MGLWQATSLVIGNMVGSGLFLLPAALAQYGSIGLLGWIVSTLGALCLALVYADLSHAHPKVGGPYVYCKEAFGDFVGFQIAWAYWVATFVANAAIVIALVSYLGFFFPSLNRDPVLALFVCQGFIWGLTALNCLGVRYASAVNLITTLFKVIPLGLISLLGIFSLEPSHFSPFIMPGHGFGESLAATVSLTLFAFIGLESATIPASDVKNPRKTIPLATILGTLLSAIVFIGSTVALMGVVPLETLAGSSAPFVEAATKLLGPWGGTAIACMTVIACFGTLNGFILLQGQVPRAAALDHLLPARFSKLSKGHSPVFGLVFSSILVSALLFFNFEASLVEQFTSIVFLTAFLNLITYLYSTAAHLTLFRTQKPLKAGIALLGFAYTLWAIIGSGHTMVFLGLITLLLGIPLYAFFKRP